MLKKIYLILLLLGIIKLQIGAQSCTGNYLHAQGNKLYDSHGNVVRLTGVNWFGFETSQLVPHGLWSRDCKSMLQQIKDQGFNCLRIPWCNDMLASGATININSYGTDPYTGVSPMNEVEATKTKPIEILDIIVEWCEENNMKIILDNHSRQHDGYMNEMLWYTDKTPESKWISDWVFMAERYKNYDAVVAMDLNNEPHGNYGNGARWGNSNPATDWNKAAERCGNAILNVNPNVLIMVEGVEEYNNETYWWGGNLVGVHDYPVQLSNQQKLVYSPHEYGPTVFNQSWFSAPDFPDNMPGIWEQHFNFINTDQIAPLLIGEFGIRDQGGTDEIWFNALLDFMSEKGYSWTFWCWNPNSGDTGGLLDDQWKNIVTWKMNLLRPHLAQEISNCGGSEPQNVPPVAVADVSPPSGQAPLTVSFDASGSTDSDGSVVSYNWNFGDGTSSSSASVRHTYTTAGNYTVNLTVTDNQGATDQAFVSILVGSSNVPVTGVSVTPQSLSLNVDETSTLSVTIEPSNASDQTVTWTSSNTSVATVSSSGMVTAVAEGTATVTVTTTDNGYTATAEITVTPIINPPVCDNPVAVSVPYAKDGQGEYCFSTTDAIAYINSWNMDLVEINGVDYTNTWSNNLPAAINGKWYIHYVGSYAWSHFEAASSKNADNIQFASGSDVKVYPNPFTDEINIDLSNAGNIQKVELFNSLGQLVKAIDSPQTGQSIIKMNIDNTGKIFILRIYTDNQVIVKRLIKN